MFEGADCNFSLGWARHWSVRELLWPPTALATPRKSIDLQLIICNHAMAYYDSYASRCLQAKVLWLQVNQKHQQYKTKKKPLLLKVSTCMSNR